MSRLNNSRFLNAWNNTTDNEWKIAPSSEMSVKAIQEEVPSLTVAAVVGVAFVMLLAIAVVFLLGVLVDCRHQKLLEQKMGDMKRSKVHRRIQQLTDNETDSIRANMEEPEQTAAPIEIVTHTS